MHDTHIDLMFPFVFRKSMLHNVPSHFFHRQTSKSCPVDFRKIDHTLTAGEPDRNLSIKIIVILGKNLQAIRKKNQLSQEGLAEYISCLVSEP